MIYHIGLGGNLGCREISLMTALDSMEKMGMRIQMRSSLYISEPVGPIEQPWFLNQVVELESSEAPIKLLRCLKSIENSMGRSAEISQGPRNIDLDILLAGPMVLSVEELQIPHKEMHQRRFVLMPLSEIAPQAKHPILRQTISRLLKTCEDSHTVKLYDGDNKNIDI